MLRLLWKSLLLLLLGLCGDGGNYLDYVFSSSSSLVNCKEQQNLGP